MGCFFACLGSSKDRRRRCGHKKHNKVQPRYQRNAADQDLARSNVLVVVEEQSRIHEKPVVISTVADEIEIQEEKPLEEELTTAVLRKKVTFDSNVRTYDPISVKESTESLQKQEVEENEEGDVTKKAKPLGESKNDDYSKSTKQSQSQSDSGSEGSSVTSSSTSYPPNHRYQNCRDSDDEIALEDPSDSDSDFDDDDDDDDDDGELDYEDNMYDDPSSRFASAAANDEGFEGKPGRNVRYVHPVLNPVENLTQWKAVKSKKLAPPPSSRQLNKENLEQEPCFKVKKSNKAAANQEEEVVAVDASLSNWLTATSSLLSDCTTPLNKQQPTTTARATFDTPERSYSVGSASPKSFEDRPILGALTVEEIRQMSASNSPIRKSPGGGHSPDDMPIIGSVGSYWSESDSTSKSGNLHKELSSASSSFKGIPNTTSKYREDKRVNWHSTPFETRLERALNCGGRVDAGDAC